MSVECVTPMVFLPTGAPEEEKEKKCDISEVLADMNPERYHRLPKFSGWDTLLLLHHVSKNY